MSGRWVFGYGSLIWRPGFPFQTRSPARVAGFVRSFCQASPDHRGTPDAPGRVVSLLRQPGARCWGMAYYVASRDLADVLALLDDRESAGYERLQVPVEFVDGQAARTALLYVATPNNPNHIPHQPLAETASIVRRARGMSGSNLEYVRRLADALREHGVTEDPVFELEALL